MNRRTFLGLAAGAAMIPVADRLLREPESWDASAYRKQERSRVAILPADRYDGSLVDVVRRGVRLFPVEVAGRRVVLKPNLVEFDPHGVINTHPVLIASAVEAFRSLGAREVVVAEGPGHRRDNEYLLSASGILEVLRESRTGYTDLNADSVRSVALHSRFMGVDSLYLPETVLSADLLVSMPKLKTHKFAGATLSMKNMFGVMPGAVYGWPKNFLHWRGIDESIVDINAALAMPRLCIVDGIVGMEGNGPIQGTPRHSGVVVFGQDPVAVDATCARLMKIDPLKLRYLQEAGRFLGNADDGRIEQIGESIAARAQDYAIHKHLQHLKG